MAATKAVYVFLFCFFSYRGTPDKQQVYCLPKSLEVHIKKKKKENIIIL